MSEENKLQHSPSYWQAHHMIEAGKSIQRLQQLLHKKNRRIRKQKDTIKQLKEALAANERAHQHAQHPTEQWRLATASESEPLCGAETQRPVGGAGGAVLRCQEPALPPHGMHRDGIWVWHE
jgi:hypothetical protein